MKYLIVVLVSSVLLMAGCRNEDENVKMAKEASGQLKHIVEAERREHMNMSPCVLAGQVRSGVKVKGATVEAWNDFGFGNEDELNKKVAEAYFDKSVFKAEAAGKDVKELAEAGRLLIRSWVIFSKKNTCANVEDVIETFSNANDLVIAAFAKSAINFFKSSGLEEEREYGSYIVAGLLNGKVYEMTFNLFKDSNGQEGEFPSPSVVFSKYLVYDGVSVGDGHLIDLTMSTDSVPTKSKHYPAPKNIKKANENYKKMLEQLSTGTLQDEGAFFSSYDRLAKVKQIPE